MAHLSRQPDSEEHAEIRKMLVLFLFDFYRKDIDEGKLTKEEASLIIADFYAKNNLIMGRGEHQISET